MPSIATSTSHQEDLVPSDVFGVDVVDVLLPCFKPLLK